MAAARTKESYLGAQYRRITARRGPKRASLAVGHSILRIAYHIIKDGRCYRDLGADYFDRRNEVSVTRSLVKRLEGLGYQVELKKAA
ncbi:MAG TPA: hypothetical protein VFC26_14485 [Verrucomicrobiae bacterium]|nr:hypothetical protein [Verrucomicrobiae bacterium]